MHIGVDIDDVLAEFLKPLTAHYNRVYNSNITFEGIFCYDLSQVWGCTPEQSIEQIKKFYTTPAFLNQDPVVEAFEHINQLRRMHTLSIITARPTDLEPLTLQWLDRHYPNIFDSIYFTNQYLNSPNRRKKSEVGLEAGIDVMIDDSLEHAYHCAEEGIRVYLYDRPWNRQPSLPQGVTRVHSWKEIAQHLNN